MSFLCMYVGGFRHGDTEVIDGEPQPRRQCVVSQPVTFQRVMEPWSPSMQTATIETYNLKRAKAIVDDLEVYIAIHDEAARHWGEWRHTQEGEYLNRQAHHERARALNYAEEYYRFHGSQWVGLGTPPNGDAPDNQAGIEYNIAGGNGNTRG